MIEDTEVVIRMEHCRKAGYCARGIRTLCARYELDYVDFLQNGISVDKLLAATGEDAMVMAVVEVARG